MAALAYAPRIGPNGQARRNRRTRLGELGAATTLRLVAVPASGERGGAAPPVAFRPVIVEPIWAPEREEPLRTPQPEEKAAEAPLSPVRTPKISHELERRVVERRVRERRARAAELRRRRLRLLAVVVSVGLTAGLWFGTSAMASQSQGRLQVLPGSVKTAHGYLYRVQPGDTVWSIATRLDPTGDPRPLADQIESEIGGTNLQVGTQVLVP
jgi:LysM domain